MVSDRLDLSMALTLRLGKSSQASEAHHALLGKQADPQAERQE